MRFLLDTNVLSEIRKGVTGNVVHFRPMGVHLLNPFT